MGNSRSMDQRTLESHGDWRLNLSLPLPLSAMPPSLSIFLTSFPYVSLKRSVFLSY